MKLIHIQDYVQTDTHTHTESTALAFVFSLGSKEQ